MEFKKPFIRRGNLPLKNKLSYGVGHILNDLCASMWFSYMLLYMHKIASFNNVNAGLLVLVGQIADALATPFVGYESDKTVNVRYGRRKIWHLVGVICVTISFPFIFSLCISYCANASETALMLYYVPFIVIFQFGWASTQISHLSLIPELTQCLKGQVELNAIRYFFTVMANLLVFAVCFVLFEIHAGEDISVLTRQDAPKFKYLAICVVAVGLVFMFIFHFGVKEGIGCQSTGLYDDEEIDSLIGSTITHGEQFEQKTIKGWFKMPLFYQVGWLYMMTRLIVNVSQVYISYFVLDTLKLHKNAIAMAPAVIYVSGIFASIIAKKLNSKFGLKLTFFLALCCIYGSRFRVLRPLVILEDERSLVIAAAQKADLSPVEGTEVIASLAEQSESSSSNK